MSEMVSHSHPLSHATMREELEWDDGIGTADLPNITQHFDFFWISGPLLRSDSFSVIDAFRDRIEMKLEKNITERHPVHHVGAFPHHQSLYYTVSPMEKLWNEYTLKVDFPLFGGFVAYDKSTNIDHIENLYRSVRDDICDILESSLEFNISVYWGFLGDVPISPNVFYFAREDGFLTASDQFSNQVSPHSIIFDYHDIVTAPISERDPDQSVEFETIHGNGDSPSEDTSISDIDIVFKSIPGGTAYDDLRIPLTKLQVEIRSPMKIEFSSGVKR